MIRVNYFQEGNCHRLSVSGHAGYSNNGNDVVCAGVSALSLALAAYLPTVANISELRYDSGELLVVCYGGKEAEIAFDMAMTGYLNIADKYPQHVEVYFAANGG